MPVTFSLSVKLKYDGSLADHIGSVSVYDVKKPPEILPATITLPFESIDKTGIRVDVPYVPATTPESDKDTVTGPGPVEDKDIPVPESIDVTA